MDVTVAATATVATIPSSETVVENHDSNNKLLIIKNKEIIENAISEIKTQENASKKQHKENVIDKNADEQNDDNLKLSCENLEIAKDDAKDVVENNADEEGNEKIEKNNANDHQNKETSNSSIEDIQKTTNVIENSNSAVTEIIKEDQIIENESIPISSDKNVECDETDCDQDAIVIAEEKVEPIASESNEKTSELKENYIVSATNKNNLNAIDITTLNKDESLHKNQNNYAENQKFGEDSESNENIKINDEMMAENDDNETEEVDEESEKDGEEDEEQVEHVTIGDVDDDDDDEEEDVEEQEEVDEDESDLEDDDGEDEEEDENEVCGANVTINASNATQDEDSDVAYVVSSSEDEEQEAVKKVYESNDAANQQFKQQPLPSSSGQQNRNAVKNDTHKNYYENDDEEDTDADSSYDDDNELMNEIVYPGKPGPLSSKIRQIKQPLPSTSKGISSSRNVIPNKELQATKKNYQNFRTKIKKRSIKWLSKKKIERNFVSKYDRPSTSSLQKSSVVMSIDIDDDDDDEEDVIEEEEEEDEDDDDEQIQLELQRQQDLYLKQQLQRQQQQIQRNQQQQQLQQQKIDHSSNMISIEIEDSPEKQPPPPKSISSNTKDVNNIPIEILSVISQNNQSTKHHQQQEALEKMEICDKNDTIVTNEQLNKQQQQQQKQIENKINEQNANDHMQQSISNYDTIVNNSKNKSDEASVKICKEVGDTIKQEKIVANNQMQSSERSKNNENINKSNYAECHSKGLDQNKEQKVIEKSTIENEFEMKEETEKLIKCTTQKDDEKLRDQQLLFDKKDEKEDVKSSTKSDNKNETEDLKSSEEQHHPLPEATSTPTISTLKRKLERSKSIDHDTAIKNRKNAGNSEHGDDENNEDDGDDDDDDTEEFQPAKKLRTELKTSFPTHNRILNEYIEKTSNNSVNEIDKHLNQLFLEIQTLNDMIKANELEWENMIHLKKVKEEICYRLQRKKHVMELVSTKFGDIKEARNIAEENCSQLQQSDQEKSFSTSKLESNLLTSTPNVTQIENNSNRNFSSNFENNIAIQTLIFQHQQKQLMQQQQQHQPNVSDNSSTTSSSKGGGITQSILETCANMKSSDLAKKRETVQRAHRLLVSRNILPKPSSTSLMLGPLASTTTSPPPSLQNLQQKDSNSTTLSSLTMTSTTVAATPMAATSLYSVPSQQKSIASATVTVPMNFQQQQQPLALSNKQTQPPPPILNSYLTAAANVKQQLDELLNGDHYQKQQLQQQINQQWQQHLLQQQQVIANGGGSGNQPLMVGRQGIIKDVKSIIADYRQKHPEQIPRRGRRLKGAHLSNTVSVSEAANSILSNALKNDGKLLNAEYSNSRPSSNDSSHSVSNIFGANTNLGNLTFKDVLAQFSKMTGQNPPSVERLQLAGSGNGPKSSTIATTSNNNRNSNLIQLNTPPYPEVTLHRVVTSQSSNSIGGGATTNNEQASGSLLHGILTKYSRSNSNNTAAATAATTVTAPTANISQQSNYKSSFSPTLARLLTAPERITTGSTSNSNGPTSSNATAALMASANSYLSKVVGQNNEITITPVTASQSSIQQALLQRQQQHQQQQAELLHNHHQQIKEIFAKERLKSENYINTDDDEADDSADRLVIDESADQSGNLDELHRIAPHAIGQEFHEHEVPICQGCKKQEAQFVCAGCGNQWYCSRECQVTAWDDHSEVCTG